MEELTVLFDAECATCRRARAWLERHDQCVPLAFVAIQSEDARVAATGLSRQDMIGDLTVIGSDGSVWRGENAFLMCLWALRRYRRWAHRLASPTLYPLARRFFRWFSDRRKRCTDGSCRV